MSLEQDESILGETMIEVSWSEYAKQYDTLAGENPWYQQLVREVSERFKRFKLPAAARIVDLCCGTANFSVQLVQQELYPQASIILYDKDKLSLELAEAKYRQAGFPSSRLQIIHDDIRNYQAHFQHESVDAALMIHALYAIPFCGEASAQKAEFLFAIHQMLKPNGFFLIADIGRQINMPEWVLAIGWSLVCRKGIREGLKFLAATDLARKEILNIQNKQRAGEYQLMDQSALEQLVAASGLRIDEATDQYFRGIDNFIVAHRPSDGEESNPNGCDSCTRR
jgi:ubiquinone/menaquinone biosynthesis C-methylase UbiE